MTDEINEVLEKALKPLMEELDFLKFEIHRTKDRQSIQDLEEVQEMIKLTREGFEQYHEKITLSLNDFDGFINELIKEKEAQDD